MVSNLQSRILSKSFVMTAEITPPLSSEAQELLEKARPLKGLADAVNVTDGASARSTMSALVAAHLLNQDGIEPILQMTCRDRNRIALQSDLVGAATLGISNLLILTGDNPKAGDQPDAKPVFDLDSSQIVATAASIRDKGELLHGRKVSGSAAFFIGVPDAPIDPKPDWEPKSLMKKLAAGAQFAQTQFCMDVEVARRYLARLHELGVPKDFPFLLGIAPLASGKSARWIRDNLFGAIVPDSIVERMDIASDPRAEGQAICADLAVALSEIEGIAGVHIMAPLNEKAIPSVIEAVRKRLG